MNMRIGKLGFEGLFFASLYSFCFGEDVTGETPEPFGDKGKNTQHNFGSSNIKYE